MNTRNIKLEYSYNFTLFEETALILSLIFTALPPQQQPPCSVINHKTAMTASNIEKRAHSTIELGECCQDMVVNDSCFSC